jgi:arylsulfatase A-like enzyme
MKRQSWRRVFVVAFFWAGVSLAEAQEPAATKQRPNVIIFVADGLRHGSVNEKDSPTLWAIRTRGVHFENSHSLFPTFTTANASAIATGHGLGDTGDFSNTIWIGYPVFDSGNFGLAQGTPIPFIENDQVLGDLDDHFRGNYLGEQTLLELAREHGYNTAAVGKLGPVGIQDAAVLAPKNGMFQSPPSTIIVDDASGTFAGPALSAELTAQLLKGNLPAEAPARSNGFAPNSPYNNGNSGDSSRPGTVWANRLQQQWFADVVTRGIFPLFATDPGKPFALLFWSRDPDGTQHNQGDSLGTLYPGINGDSSTAAIRNADRNLRQLLDWLDDHPAIRANTDIFVTSDHGFATVSRREIDRLGNTTSSEAAKHYYLDANGRVETNKGTLPVGFLAIDLALGLKTNLFDPDRHLTEGRTPYKRLRLDFDSWEHPLSGNGLLADDLLKADGSDAKAIVAANGGSDLIYVPDGNVETVRRIVRLLLTYDYVGGVFVDNKYGAIPGALPLDAIGFVGSSSLPRPAIAVAFKVFYLNPADLQTAVQIADTSLQEGQGMHGGIGRESTFNNMAAMGPDFKQGFTDPAPVSNADITPTLARLMGITPKPEGTLQGRVINEALTAGSNPAAVKQQQIDSPPLDGVRTVLHFQELEGERYLDSACLVVAAAPNSAADCRH